VDNVRKGQSRTFTVNPGRREPVTVSVIADGGGSAFKQIVTNAGALRLGAVGSKAKPAIRQR
jgi:hypothetical protein